MISDFRLTVFLTVALKKNFTKAARELCVSQPAVSKHIAEIEQEIGDSVFSRERGEVNLTDKGKILLDYAERILNLYERLNRELVPGSPRAGGELRICCCEMAAKFLLPPIIAKFKDPYPEIGISLMTRDDNEIAHLLEEGMIDIGIVSTPLPDTQCEVFAKISLQNIDNPLTTLYFAYDNNSEKKELISKFILTCKTFR